MRRFVLIGGGHASASAARALRREGFDGDIVIVGDEAHAPYQRPVLSKDYMTGEIDREEIWSISAEWCAEQRVRLLPGTSAVRIDIERLEVELEDGSRLDADAVLIATGVRPRRLPAAPSPRVHYLKTLDDADRLRTALESGARVAIVGGGFIGLEVAAAARARGAQVTLFEAGSEPLAHILGEQVGTIVGHLHREQGVDLRCNLTVAAVEDVGGEVRLTLGDGSEHRADIVVVGIGVIPNDEIARASEITVGNGIRVDQFCRTSAPGVFAAGDVANHYHPGIDGRLRVEHFDNASRQGTIAARNMLGQRVEYDDVHWFWSDQYDHSIQFAGHAAEWDRILMRGDPDNFDFVAFYMKGDRIVAAFGMDRGGEVLAAKSLIAERRPIGDELLADEAVDLGELQFDESGSGEPEPPDAESASIGEAGYTRVARSGQVTEGIVRRFMVGDLELAVARWEGTIYALHNLCTHLACKLTAGKVDQAGLTCLCHGSIFELATGLPINPPATKPVRTFPALERDGQIFVRVQDR